MDNEIDFNPCDMCQTKYANSTALPCIEMGLIGD